MTDIEKIFERIEGYREEVIELQGSLSERVALGPENGGTGEHEKARFVKGLFQETDPAVLEEINAPDERAMDGYRPNVIARWEGGEPDHTVWVLSHLDVVPPGDLSLWEGDPYKVRVEGERIIGRGVEDNQHGLVSSFLALKGILDSGMRPKRTVGLAVVADEETGSRYGLDYLLKNRRDLFQEDDLIIVPDWGTEDGSTIEVAEKSMLWIRFTVLGRQCHASTPDRGNNSLFGAASLIVALQELKDRFDFVDTLYTTPRSTFEPTKIEANVPNVNTIPGKDVFYVDCRILPRYRVEEVLEAAKALAQDLGGRLGLEVEVEIFHRQDATSPTPPDAAVVEALAGAIKRVTGREARAVGIGGGTVAAFFRQAGLPAAVWSTLTDTAHQPNEYCLLPHVLTDAKIFASLYMGE